MRYLIIRPGAIGDAIVTLPVVQQLKESLPEAFVELVVSGAAAELLRGRCRADVVSDYHDSRWTTLFAETPSPALRAHLEGFATAILYLMEPRDKLARRLQKGLGIRAIIWPPLPDPKAPLPISLHLQGALTPLGIAPRPLVPTLYLTCKDRAFAQNFWTEHHLPTACDVPVVAVHPGSGSNKKNWPANRFAALCRKLAQDDSVRILIIAGPADEALVQRLLSEWQGALPVAAQSLTLAQVGALLDRCHCLVGNDSGIAHLAAALGRPVVVIFGPTDPRIWAPQGPAVAVANPAVPCAPCTPERRRACTELSCLEDISVEDVLALVHPYLQMDSLYPQMPR